MPSLRLLTCCGLLLAPCAASALEERGLEGQGRALSGRVADPTGRGVEGARVLACPMMATPAFGCATAITERGGAFRLHALGPSAYRVTAETETSSGERIASPGMTQVDIALSLFGRITGTATDDAGRPLVGASIRAWLRSTDQEVWSHSVVTDRAGRFDVPRLVPGPYVLVLRQPRLGREALLAVDVAAGALVRMGSVPLATLPTLRGVVVDTDDVPVAGARVEADEAVRDPGGPPHPVAVTGVDGTFAVQVRPGPLRLAAAHPRFIATESKVNVSRSSSPPLARLVMNRGGRVQGLVREHPGGRLRVLLTPSTDERRASPASDATVAADVGRSGTFVFERAPAGRATLVLTVDGAAGQQLEVKEIEILEGRTTTVDFTCRGVKVAGRITVLGRPAPGLRVDVRLARAREPNGVERQTPITISTTTDGEGAYAFVAPSPGVVTLEARGHDGCSRLPLRTIQVPAVEQFTADVDFAPIVFTGTVADAVTHQPLEKAVISIAQAGTAVGAAFDAADETGEDGAFRLCVDPGDYLLALRREGYVAQTTRVRVAADSPGLRLEMTRGGAIEGQVSDSSGKPVASAVVSAAVRDADRVRSVATSITDASGSFRMSGLADQDHTLFVRARDGAVGTVAGARPGAGLVAITLQEQARVVIRLLEPGGQPVENGSIQLTRIDGIAVAAFPVSTTAPDGTAAMTVPPGEVTLLAWKGPLGARTSITLTPGAALQQDVTLHPPPSK